MYKIQEISKSGLIQIARVILLSGSARSCLIGYSGNKIDCLTRVKAGLMSEYVLSSSEHSVLP